MPPPANRQGGKNRTGPGPSSHAHRVGAALLFLVASLPAALGPGRDHGGLAESRVLACERAHHMTGASVRPAGTETRVFASCAWPARPGADPDGYMEIVSREDAGPGLDEASGIDQADRITGPCLKFRLIYRYSAQGTEDQVGLVAPADMITSVYRHGPDAVAPLPFARRPGELDVLRSGRYALDSATCNP